jgi:hypothetical protein
MVIKSAIATKFMGRPTKVFTILAPEKSRAQSIVRIRRIRNPSPKPSIKTPTIIGRIVKSTFRNGMPRMGNCRIGIAKMVEIALNMAIHVIFLVLDIKKSSKI